MSVRALSRDTPDRSRPIAMIAGMPGTIVGQFRSPRTEREDHVGGLHELERRGKNANHGVRPVIQRDCLANDGVAAAEAPLPETVAQQNRRTAGGLIFVICKGAAANCLHSQQGKQIVRRHLRLQAFGLARAGERHGRIPCRRYPLERPILHSPVLQILPRRSDCRDGRHPLRHQAQARGIAKRQRLQEHRLDHAENGGVRADSYSQGEHRDGRESRTLQKPAHGVAEVISSPYM
jgi:hypothetical protein